MYIYIYIYIYICAMHSRRDGPGEAGRAHHRLAYNLAN